MKKEELFFIGLGGSILANILWKAWPEHENFKKAVYKLTSPEDLEKSPLAFLEHYHWGLASLCGGVAFNNLSLDGFGVGMVASEAVGNQPFGIGKSEYEVKGNIAVGTVLSGILLSLLGNK